MNLKAIRDEARRRMRDEAVPPMWSDPWLDSAANEAECEACLRAHLIEDATSRASSIEVTTDEKRYPLHESVINVIACEWASNPGVQVFGWTLTETDLVFDEYPRKADTLLMTVDRMPLRKMESACDEPEIRSHHHVKLIDWIEHRCYGVKDSDYFSPGESEKALMRFEQSFGIRQDANVERKHRRKHAPVVRMATF